MGLMRSALALSYNGVGERRHLLMGGGVWKKGGGGGEFGSLACRHTAFGTRTYALS